MICSSSRARSRSACTTSSSCTLLNSRGLQSRLNWSTGSWWQRSQSRRWHELLVRLQLLRPQCSEIHEVVAEIRSVPRENYVRYDLHYAHAEVAKRSQFLTNGLVIGRPTPAKGLPHDFTFSWSLMNRFFLKDRCALPDQMSFLSACSRRTLVLAHRDRNRANKN